MQKRCDLLKKLNEEKKRQFYESQIGRHADVLIESEGAINGTCRGKSRNYIPVVIHASDIAKNTEIKVMLKEIKGKEVIGAYEC